MIIVPIRTGLLKKNDDLAKEILNNTKLQPDDILVISSKAIATTEGSAMNLGTITPSPDAIKYAKICNLDPTFTECILREMKRMNGYIASTCPFALLTSLKPTGMKTGRILCPNAGMDQSNIGAGSAVGWPIDPVVSAQKLRKALGIPVIISDSCCRPSRLGVTAFALVCAGIEPLRSEIGKKDLFGNSMRVTYEAVADQLATAANAVMGNTDQCCPAAIIRNSGIAASSFCGWVDGIEPDEDMFGSERK
jgi:coenzyme F420-0:L-glutamate ligase